MLNSKPRWWSCAQCGKPLKPSDKWVPGLFGLIYCLPGTHDPEGSDQ